MISPIHIITIGLGGAFFLGFVNKNAKNFALIFTLIAIALMGVISSSWLFSLLNGGKDALIFTAGFKPPYSINLLMGLNEAFLTTIINLVGFLGAIYLMNALRKSGNHTFMVLLIFIMGLNVIVMTRDAFNLFVFMEVASIATAGLIVLVQNGRSFQAGFKYLVATGIISGIYLLGVIIAYYFSGTLNIDSFATANLAFSRGGSLALMMILSALVLELKPFPANGWAIDAYESAHPGISAIISAGSTTALYYVLYKMMALVDGQWYNVIAIAGMITFVGSNLIGIKQTKAQRLLGYSSVGQLGLLVAILGLKPFLGDKFEFIAVTILLSHYLAKAGLFWLAGIVKNQDLKSWTILRSKPILMVLFGTFIFTLSAFPPFPAFYGKWELIMQLSAAGKFGWMAFILIGSFFEAIYLFRWFSNTLKLELIEDLKFKVQIHKFIPVTIFGILAYVVGYFAAGFMDVAQNIDYIPLLFIAFIAAIDFTKAWIKNTISIIGVTLYAYTIFPSLEGDLLRQIFLGIFLGGAVITLFSGYYNKGVRLGFYPMALTMFVGLTMLITAGNLFEILYGWELMAIGSYFLLIRGKKSLPHGYSYLLFSVAGSYTIMYGFALAYASFGSVDLQALTAITVFPTLAYSLILLGFMTKTASFGLHVWLPGAHGEAVADIHFMASAILLKAGVFGIILVLLGMGSQAEYAKNIIYVLGWLGAISALVGNLTAVFQESAKRLLAWSSIGQLGYIVFGLATMSHLGWLAALLYTIIHFMYKGVLFLIVGGIALKLGTPLMYKMGGLIKRMPYSFFAVMIAIIALSGIPPLVGFAGKWLFYNAIVIEKLYFQGIVILFSGIVAFLYLFRLIHSIFLGQLKDEHRNVSEISIWLLIPVYLLLIAIMVVSAMPEFILQPLGTYLTTIFPNGGLVWDGALASTDLGYWNAFAIMSTVMVTFLAVLIWSLILNRKPQRIGQFNIVYSAEAPERPETTHVAYNMYAGYNKALGFLITPIVEKFWARASEWLASTAQYFGTILYTGNGQTYATYVVMYVIAFYFMTMY